MRNRLVIAGLMVSLVGSILTAEKLRSLDDSPTELSPKASEQATSKTDSANAVGGDVVAKDVSGASPSTVAVAPVREAIGSLPAYGVDLSGEVHHLSDRSIAIVLLGTECPVSRTSIETLNALAPVLQKEGIELLGLISDPVVTREEAVKFAGEYKVGIPVLFDSSGQFSTFLSPRRLPEAFVIDSRGQIKYAGRIDNTYESLGKRRTQVTSFDLRDAAIAVAHGKEPAVTNTDPVGCVFEAWNGISKVDSSVTYHRDIAPLLAANCVSCHKAGQVGPFALTSFKDASKRANLLSEVVVSGYMPPWRAGPQPNHFADERRLSKDDIILFQRWAQLGAPEGDPAEALPQAKEALSPWRLGTPDLVIEMPKAFDVPASGKDVYRAFPVSVQLPEDKYIIASEFQAGAPSVVHHALIYVDASGAARKKEQETADGQPGYVSFGGPGFVPTSGLGGWAPGASPAFLPDGVGKPLARGSDVVLQIHYHPDGIARSDKSKLGIYFAKKPVTRVAFSFPLGTRKIDIAPGDTDYTKVTRMTLPRDVELISVTPHMHLLGKSMTCNATLPNGEVIQLFSVPDWDFRWQDQYRYAQPMTLPRGTHIETTTVYDNSINNPANPSNPPQRVTWGEQTTDEMCLVFFQAVVPIEEASTIKAQLLRAAIGGAALDRLRGLGTK